jgi:hypothetical protein
MYRGDNGDLLLSAAPQWSAFQYGGGDPDWRSIAGGRKIRLACRTHCQVDVVQSCAVNGF